MACNIAGKSCGKERRKKRMSNEIETESFEVIKVLITVLNVESGSKATIGRFYKLGTKKTGDKYITITGIPDFYKRNAESLTEDAITIKLDPSKNGTLIGGSPKHNEKVIMRIYSNDELMIYQATSREEIGDCEISANWIDDIADKIEIIFPCLPRLIELKTTPEYFEAQRKGVKNFEIRKNDREYKVDDVLWLKEYDPEKERYTGRTLKRKITYITSYNQKEGYVVLGTKRLTSENEE